MIIMANTTLTPSQAADELAKQIYWKTIEDVVDKYIAENPLDAVCDKHITKSDNLIMKSNK